MAAIRNNQKKLFLPLLTEQGVYSISNFKVVPGPALYRSVDRDHSINFFYNTKIEGNPDNDLIPRYRFELQPFANVKNLVGQLKCLIDVIGMALEKRSNRAEKMDVLLTNDRDEDIVVTLWEERAYQFKSSLAAVDNSAIFVVITGLIAKKFSDNVSLSSSDATKTYFNIDYAPLDNLRDGVAAGAGRTLAELLPPAITQFVTMGENMAQEMDIKSVLEVEIPAGKDLVRCVCKATIIDILDGNGWYYDCCAKCARAVRTLEGKYYCISCAEDAKSVAQRYRVVVRIQDHSETTTLTLFNKEAEQLTAVPIKKILDEATELPEPNEIPTAVKKIIGKICVFQIKVTKYNITHGCEEYTVTRVSECSTAGSSQCSTAGSSQADKETTTAMNKKQRRA